MDDLFSNPFWHGLKTEQARLAIGSGLARRYPADVIPFAGLEAATTEAMLALRELVVAGEDIYVTGDKLPDTPNMLHVGELPGWQMHLTANVDRELPPERSDSVQLRALGTSDASAMVTLTDVAFPGFFRLRTVELGQYYGIHIDGELIAMAGERIALPGFREISAVCTHPAHTGQGYAAILIKHLLRVHSDAGLRSFLHVTATNRRAIGLYERLGFVKTRPILFHRLRGL